MLIIRKLPNGLLMRTQKIYFNNRSIVKQALLIYQYTFLVCVKIPGKQWGIPGLHK